MRRGNHTQVLALEPLAGITRMHIAKIALVLMLAATMAFPAAARAVRAPSDTVGGTPLSAGTVRAAAAPNIDAAAGAIVTSQGRVIWSRKGDVRRPMASTTKMMTALLVVEKGGFGKKVRISKKAARVSYGLGLKAGEKISVAKLLELTMVASSNDAAYALGEYHSGDMASFVRAMNTRADALGLEDTRFANPHGLDAKGHYSTPIDLAKLAQAGMAKPVFRKVVRMKSVRMPKAKGRSARTIKATDKLLGVYPGIAGVKTGYTNGARFSFVGQATRKGITLTTAILGASSGQSRFTQTAKLLDWGYKNMERRTLGEVGAIAAEVPIKSDPTKTVPVRIAKNSTKLIFKLDGKISQEASVPAELPLPIFEGQTVGTVNIKQGKRVVASLPVVATTSIASVEATVGAIPVSDYLDRTIAIKTTPTDSEVPAFDADKPVDQRLDVQPQIAAPVSAGDSIGELVYSQNGEVITRVPVIAAESVERPGFVSSVAIALSRGWREVVGRPTMATPRLDS